LAAHCCGILAVAGLGLFWGQFAQLWSIWTVDSLRSIGALVMPASLALLIRGLSAEDFAAGGSWWGLALIAAAGAGADLEDYGQVALVLGRSDGFHLPPVGLLLYLYASGVVVLFGGAGAWRKAGFALFLLLFVNPVPPFFTNLIDLPLQHLGAQAARSFAKLLGVPVSGAALKLMFFHDGLGMFIAPGCNGLQGAVAMGGLALVIGHLRGMRMLPHLLIVAGAVALAYIFNLLRLCLLVLYYCLAHLWPALGGYAVGADYVIGGMLFTLAAAFLFGVSR
jgi:exosortase J